MLREIQGRTTDFVVAADGTVMHGLALIYILRDLHGVNQFKIIQESRLLTRVLIATGPDFDTGSMNHVAAKVRERLGAEVQVDVKVVDHIPAEKSGKFRYVVSYVNQASIAPACHA